jgi:hypothetical protein
MEIGELNVNNDNESLMISQPPGRRDEMTPKSLVKQPKPFDQPILRSFQGFHILNDNNATMDLAL